MRKLNFFLILGVFLLPVHAYALGLGEIHVNSKLNQQLDARIDLLSTSPEDAEVLIVKLASREEFIKAGLDRPHELNDLKFRTLVEEGRVYVTVASPKPVREPSLSFLVEVDWPTGHLIREYTVLLEPPASMRPKGSQAADPASSRPAVHEATSAAQSSAEADGFRPAQQP